MDPKSWIWSLVCIVGVLLPLPLAMLAAVAVGIDVVALLGVVASTAVAWAIVRRRSGTWRDLGFEWRGRVWARIASATGLALVLLVVTSVLTPLVAQLTGETLDISRFDVLRGNVPALLVGLVVVWTVAAFGEELVFRGFVLNELAALFGGRAASWGAGLVATSAIFGLAHLYQGWVGVIMTGIVGLGFGAIYLAYRRNLWMPVLTHGIYDTIAFIAVFFSLDRLG